MYETGRVQLIGNFVSNMWITGAIVYGFPLSKFHKQPLSRTNAMLQHVVEHMLLYAKGPRFLCGDWNHKLEELDICELLVQQGWQEVQTLQKPHHGTEVQFTCKHKTRKDFLWISPELVGCFQRAEVIHDLFPDHSVLKASFRLERSVVTRYVWPSPQPVAWPPLDNQCDVSFAADSDPTEQYRQLWQQHEASARQSLGIYIGTRGWAAERHRPNPMLQWHACNR